jgi:hypothetical protein
MTPHPRRSISTSSASATSAQSKASLGVTEIYVFGAICLLDMLSTVYFYDRGLANESNPILSYWLKRSVTAFCVAKLLSFVPMLAACAYYRTRNAAFVVKALRIAMAAYITIYVCSVGAQLIR